jgi:hypothetical protein
MGGVFVEALLIAASLATTSHPGVAILAASAQLKPDTITQRSQFNHLLSRNHRENQSTI